jgi:glucose-1-phosphate cytidylyltransferase
VKVVLFCGGLGTRLREHSDTIPKPLVNIGPRPIIWHLMRYYAHYGHTDFVLCLGYRGDLIREYFLKYDDTQSNDFTLTLPERKVQLHSSDVCDWRITFVDTGMHSNIGQRLTRVRKHLENEECFLANYSDCLSDIPLDRLVQQYRASNVVAMMSGVRNLQSFHTVHSDPRGLVTRIGRVHDSDLLVNGGYFVLRSDIFDYMEPGDELVEQPFARLIQNQLLGVYRHDGFWQSMDTFKDKITLDRMEAQGNCPWMRWRNGNT